MALMYPLGPTSSAVRCSVSDPFFTTSVCVPEVAPVSPCTVMLVPLCLAVELKCTPCVPTAFMAAWYWVWALGVGDAAAPAARKRAGRDPRQGGDGGKGTGSRGGADGEMAQGAHDVHSPGDRARRRSNAPARPVWGG